MKATFVLSALVAAVSAIPASTPEPTFQFFATLTCANDRGPTISIPRQTLIDSIVTSVAKKTYGVVDKFGANDTATLHCNSVSGIPLLGVNVNGAGVLFAYNPQTQVYYFCGAQAPAADPASGYPLSCDES